MTTGQELADFVHQEGGELLRWRGDADVVRAVPLLPGAPNGVSFLDMDGYGLADCDRSASAVVVRGRYMFDLVVRHFFPAAAASSVKSQATAHYGATFGRNCHIGDGAVIYPWVRMGDDCVIGANTVIGGDGFGFIQNELGTPVRQQHSAGVVLGNRVEIGANTCIDRGMLADTRLDDDVKVDNLVHIAHAVHVGARSSVVAGACLCGSCVIGMDTWIAPHAVVKEHVRVGSRVTVGLGAVVLKDVPDGVTVAGVPARILG